jgi:hypothetical protein
MTLKRTVTAMAFFTALTVPGWALAQETHPVVDAMLKNLEAQYKIKPMIARQSSDATSATIEGLEFSMPVESGGSGKISVGRIELRDIADKGNGLYEIGQATYSDTSMNFGVEGQSFTISVPQSSAESQFIKVAEADPSAADRFRTSLNIARHMSAGPMTITAAGQTITVDGMDMTWDGDPVTGAGKSVLKISNVVVPESTLALIDPTGTLKQLGYSNLAFDLGGEGTMSNDGTNFGMDFDFYYAGKDMGTMRFGTAVSGVPLAAIAELQKTEPGKEPDMNALMPQLTGVQIGRIVFRFEDASITKKILPMIAQMQGMDEATFIANAGAMAQIGLAELRSPDFTQKAVTAISTFLNDPQSITIAAKPAAPVTVMQLMALDPSNPAAAIEQLGISVTAND